MSDDAITRILIDRNNTVAEYESELTRLRAENSELILVHKENVGLSIENKKLRQKLAKAVEALEFYANTAWTGTELNGMYQPWMNDKGKRARQTLKEIGEAK